MHLYLFSVGGVDTPHFESAIQHTGLVFSSGWYAFFNYNTNFCVDFHVICLFSGAFGFVDEDFVSSIWQDLLSVKGLKLFVQSY